MDSEWNGCYRDTGASLSAREVKTPNKYTQFDLCWTNFTMGFIWCGPGQSQGHQGNIRQEREGLWIIVSYQGYNMWHYSQQDLIDSGLGGGKASKKAATTKPLGLFVSSLGGFFSLPVLAAQQNVLLTLCIFTQSNRAVTEMLQGRVKTKEN